MKMKISFLFFAVVFLISCEEKVEEKIISEQTAAYDLVNPFIGTGGHGHTYPGATLPFGMVQLSPDTRLEGWDGCSGYHNTDSIIYGFSHTHLSGTGVGDYGDVLLMPTSGLIQFDNGHKTGSENGYASVFSKETESASPGYYEVELDEHDIDVRLTATTSVGVHEYTFNEAGSSNIILDLVHRDQLLKDSIHFIGNDEVEGCRISSAWASEQHVYFVAQFSKGCKSHFLDSTGKRAAFIFDTKPHEKIVVRVGISATSIEGARKNLEAEAPHWDFDKYLSDAKSTWETALRKIEIEDENKDKKSIFYTALYHSMIAPNTFSDVDGKYRGMDHKIHESDETTYTVFSLWDTFRAAHPLYTIIEQKKTNEFINTFLHQYQQGGELPIWELAANYTGCMIGYHSVPVIADAYVKGIRGYDVELALEAMIHSAEQDKLGLRSYKANGFIAAGDEAESVSKTLEYSYDDWCIAIMAKGLKQENVFNRFIERAQYYKNIFNPEVGFMQSKMNGGWNTGFDPAEVNFNFTEANSWQYSMFAPQDISGLIKLYGGNEAFESKLDLLFSTEMELSGRHQVDITGLIGQYAHGNEPSHHMAYLYNYIGKPWKTQERIHQILNEQYSNQPDGLSGNEDCGQMSAWYVLSSMGFYSVTPGLDYYSIGTPHLSKATINLENGNKFKIIANNLSGDNSYIQSASLNGGDFNQSFLYHDAIMQGGEIVFEMGNMPNKNWGVENLPIAAIKSAHSIIPVPFISASSQTFTDSIKIEIKSVESENVIYYRIDSSGFEKYEASFFLKESASVQAYALKSNIKSATVNTSFKKIDGGRSILLNSKYSNQYGASGDNALIDFLKGSANFRTGYWQGYYASDFSAIVDLGRIEPVKKISVGALQEIKSWIWFPKSVKISYSENNETFKVLATIKNDFADNEYGGFTKEFSKIVNETIYARYIKIEAVNYGVCPGWHPGSGNDTWMFLDEIEVE
jgi:predicted alpha-1,2-mannosidase